MKNPFQSFDLFIDVGLTPVQYYIKHFSTFFFLNNILQTLGDVNETRRKK